MSFIVPTGQWTPVCASRNRLCCRLNSPIHECVFKCSWTAWTHLAYISVQNTSRDVGAAILVTDTHFFLKINLNIVIVLRFGPRQNRAKSSIRSKSTAGLLLSAIQQTGTTSKSHRVFSLDAWVMFFFFFFPRLDAGSHWSFHICLTKENVTFVKKMRDNNGEHV